MTVLVPLAEVYDPATSGILQLALPPTPPESSPAFSQQRRGGHARRISTAAAPSGSAPARSDNGSAGAKKQANPMTEPSSTSKPFARSADDAESSMRGLIRQLKASQRVVVVCGAGVSTAASIPDFRSAAGLFKDKNKGKGRARGENMRDLFSVQCLSDDNLLPLHQELINDLCDMSFNAEPTAFHELLREMDMEGRLLRCYTQNIDGLERKAGMQVGIPSHAGLSNRPSKRRKTVETSPSGRSRFRLNADHVGEEAMRESQAFDLPPTPPADFPPSPPAPHLPAPRVIPLHGQLEHMYCILCFAAFPTRDYLPLPSVPIACPRCEAVSNRRRAMSERQRSVGCLRAGVVLYGEEHPAGESIGKVLERDLRGSGRKGEREGKVDFLLVAGTSLTIPGVKRMIKEMAKSLRSASGSPKGKGRLPKPPRTVFVNDEPPRGSDWEGVFDIWVKGDIQQFVRALDDPLFAPPMLLPTPVKTPRKRKLVNADLSSGITPSSIPRLHRRTRTRDSIEVSTPTKATSLATWLPTPRPTPASTSTAASVASRDSPELTPVPDDWVPMSPTPPPMSLPLDWSCAPTADRTEQSAIPNEAEFESCIVAPEGFRSRLRASTLRSSARTTPVRRLFIASPAKIRSSNLAPTELPQHEKSGPARPPVFSDQITATVPRFFIQISRSSLSITKRHCPANAA